MWKKNKKGLYLKDLQLDLEKLNSIYIPKFDLQLFAEDSGSGLVDFETGDLTQFDSTTEEGTNTLTAHGDYASHGSYGCQCLIGNSPDCYGEKQFTTASDIYARMYLKLSSTFDLQAQYNRIQLFTILDGTTELVYLAMRSTASSSPYTPNEWYVRGTVISTDTFSDEFALNTEHYVEIRWVKSATVGGAEVWINGTKYYTDIDGDTSAYDADRVYAGFEGSVTPDSGDFMNIDDVKIDTSYIGAYSDVGGGNTKLLRAIEKY